MAEDHVTVVHSFNLENEKNCTIDTLQLSDDGEVALKCQDGTVRWSALDDTTTTTEFPMDTSAPDACFIEKEQSPECLFRENVSNLSELFEKCQSYKSSLTIELAKNTKTIKIHFFKKLGCRI